MRILQELLSLREAKGEYNSFKSWKAAIKKKHPDAWIEGDEDIAQAMVGPKPYKHGETKAVGEWDGAKGELFESNTLNAKMAHAHAMSRARNAAEAGRGQSARDFMGPHDKEYEPVLKAHGFKRQANGSWYKTAGFGIIKIDKHGHWEHTDVGESEGGSEYEGTTGRTLDRHLSQLFKD